MTFKNQNWKPTTKRFVFERLVAETIAGLNDSARWNDKTVFPTINILPEPNKREDVFVTLTPGESQFEQDLLEGGGQETCLVKSSVIFSVYSRQRTDQSGRADDSLLGESNGDLERSLFDLERKLLQIFTDKMLLDPGDNFRILTNKMQPASTSHPYYSDERARLLSFSIVFSLDFAWDLT